MKLSNGQQYNNTPEIARFFIARGQTKLVDKISDNLKLPTFLP